MYKALFELSADRAEFVSRLFSKKRPEGLTSTSTAQEIFAAYEQVETSEALYKANLAAIDEHLVKTRGLQLNDDDLKGIEYVYYQFFWYGPSIQDWSTGASGRGGRSAPTFADLMMADDGEGHASSFLASEENFSTVKELEARNLLVPVVGNFAGPKALRESGTYAERTRRDRRRLLPVECRAVSAAGTASGAQFCGNVAMLPLDDSSTFIRSVRSGNFVPGVGLDSELGNMMSETRACGVAGAVDLLSRVGAFVVGRPPASPTPWRR